MQVRAARSRCRRSTRLARRTRGVTRSARPAADSRDPHPRSAMRSLLDESRVDLHRAWSATTHAMQRLRDNPRQRRPGIRAHSRRSAIPASSPVLTFDPADDVAAPFIATRRAARRSRSCASRASTARSRWRRRSIAPASTAIDVHMTDILRGPPVARRVPRLRRRAADFRTATCSGAGEGWAKSILFNARARDDFAAFFARRDTFALGVCNGCQMMSNLARAHSRHRALAALRAQPRRSSSRRASCMLEVTRSPSLFFARHGGQPHSGRDRRTAKAAPSFAMRRSSRAAQAARRAALRRQPRAARPKRIRSMPTDRRAASPGSRRPMAASRS